MPTTGDPSVPARPKPNVTLPYIGHSAESTPSGSLLLAGLMWSAYVASAFLVMLGVIVPTWGNVFIILTFLIVAVATSFSRAGEK